MPILKTSSGKNFFKKILLLLLISSNCAQAQDLQTVIPPSPEAQSFMRYGEIPVDFSTGVPKIDIPLYTVQSKKISVPITISYHGSGIKVKDVASIVGLGWVLNAGGIVASTRMDRGDAHLAANYNTQYKTTADMLAAKTTAENQGANSTVIFGQNLYNDYNYRNKQNDRYFYQTASGKTGIFRFDFLNDALIKLPYEPIKIVESTDNKKFTITEIDGTISTYEQIAIASTSSGSWYLTSIKTADQSDTIQFVYDQSNYNSCLQLFYSQQVNWGGFYPAPGGNGPDGCPVRADYTPPYTTNYNETYQGTSTITPLLKSIISSNTIVDFFYANGRADGTQFRITEIKVSDKASGALIKDFNFNNQSYFGSSSANNQRLKLSGLTVKDDQSMPVQNYTFVYDESVSLPPYVTLDGQGRNLNREDFWGYYNGSSLNGMIPYQYMPASVPDAYKGNRDPDANFARAYMIKEVHYPTGGLTKFEFEPNYVANAYNYYSVYNPNPAAGKDYIGGFRIRRIRDYANDVDTTIVSLVKTYEYSGAYTGTINREYFTYGQRYFYSYSDGVCTNYNYVSDRTMAVSSSLSPLTLGNGAPIMYAGVTEYYGTPTNNQGKTEYSYVQPHYFVSGEDPRRALSYPIDYGMYTPLLLTKLVSKNVGGVFQPVHNTQNTYVPYRNNLFNAGISIFHNTTYSINGTNLQEYDLDQNGVAIINASTSGYANYFNYSDIMMSEEANMLTQTDEIDFSDVSNPVTQTTNYSYANQDHLLPTQKTVTGSAADTWITQYKYPHDFVSQSPYNLMVNTSHIWNPVIEQLEYKNSTGNFLKSTKTDYGIWNGNNAQIYPSTISTKKGSVSYDPRVQFLAYNANGNIQSLSKTDGSKINYIYGYGGSYPIAQITNADYSTIETLLGGQTNVDSFRDMLNPTDLQVNNFLANLRVAGNLPNAQVITYTYKPLVGMASATDTKGITTYYEYDSFQRLRFVRNKDHNIVKAYCYNYKGQQTNCFTPQTPAQQLVYARIEISNITYSNSGDYEYNYSSSYGDAYVHFYSDAECQHELTLTSAMTVTMAETLLYDTEYSYGTNVYNIDYNIPTGVSSYYLGNMTLYDYSSYNDGYNYHYNYNDYTYDMVPHTGSNYTPETTINN